MGMAERLTVLRKSRRMELRGIKGWVGRGLKALQKSREVEPIGNRRMRL